MKTKITKRDHRLQRHARVKARIIGTSQRPRMSVFRSNRYVWVQLIDDVGGKTLVQVTNWEKLAKGKKAAGKESHLQKAERVGEKIAALAREKNILTAVFDRGGYKYHGRVKAIADGARKAGIKL